jgi:nicotinic acetylcholine receptor, invertebrate
MFYLLFLFLNLINLFSVNLADTFERDLKTHLLQDYRTDSLPIINNSAVDLNLGIALRSFTEINQLDGTLSINIWLRHWWYDEYLRWEPSNWNNISSIVLFTDSDMGESIWVPDIYLYNTAENPLSELNEGRVKIYNDGYILWSRPGIIKSTCTFNLTSFPYDEQNCNLKFGSWSYHGDEVNLNPGTPAIDISELQPNQEWDLVNHTFKKNVKYYTCCPEPYPDVTFNITLRRRPGFYNTNILLPAFATASLMLLSLVVPSESGERIGFVTTVMLSIIVFLLILSENLPKSDTEPLLSRMLIGLTFFSLISVFVTVILEAMRNYNKKKLACLPNICCNKKSGNVDEDTPEIEIIREEKSMFRSGSYLRNVNGNNKISGVKTTNIENENKAECDKECESYANVVEVIFMGIFTSVFIIYCFVMFGERPIYDQL